MRIGVLKESAPRERRVALNPDAVAKLIKAGDTVVVEHGAGAAAYYPDEAYVAAGAQLGDAQLAGAADLVCKVQCPSPAEVASLREGAVLLTLTIGDSGTALQSLATRQVSVLALERVPRITRAQSMDVLSSQATVAGSAS